MAVRDIIIRSRIIINFQHRRHVFRDLHPYVCLAKDCETADQDFERLGRTGGGTGNTVITLPDEDSEELEIPSGTPYKST